MASFGCMKLYSSMTFLGLCTYSFPFTRRFLSSKHIYLKKFKHKSNPKMSDIDVQQILMRGKTAPGSVVMSGDTSETVEKKTTTSHDNSWKNSKQRLEYLKTSEKRIAVIAVLTMLFGYVGVKWMVSVPSGRGGKGEDESQSTDEQTVQPTS